MENNITGRRLILVDASTLPQLGITNVRHVKVRQPPASLVRPDCSKRSRRRACVLPLFRIFNDFCQTNYLNIHLTDLHRICIVGKTVTVVNDVKFVFDPSRDVTVAAKFCWFYRLLSSIHSSRAIRGGVRQKVQLLRWMQANQLTDQLTIINRQLGDCLTGYRQALLCIYRLNRYTTFILS